jgi:hypothetical protein
MTKHLFCMIAGTIFSVAASAGVISYSDLAAFNAATGTPPVAISFDGFAANSVLPATVAGVSFAAAGGNSLNVVAAADTFSTPGGAFPGYSDAVLLNNTLLATSGKMVLSPGGKELVPGPATAQEDGLTLTFATPVAAFGLDILFQSYDFGPFLSIAAFDQNGSLVYFGGPVAGAGGGGSPAATVFWGIQGTLGTTISRIEFDDSDRNNDNPDSNIGYDTLRFAGANVAVPEPGTIAFVGLGLIAAFVARSRR